MNYKTGKCADCPAVTKLVAGRCSTCYWKHRAKVKSEAKKLRGNDKGGTDEIGLKDWFTRMINKAPACCEECGQKLSSTVKFIPTAIVAHIWPKRETYGYPSVKTVDDNAMYYCIDCHTNFDNKGHEFVKIMRSFPEIQRRATIVYHLMTPDEQRRAIKNFDYLILD